MQAAITGASGLLGANLAIELLRQGVAVRCTRRGQSVVKHLAAFPIEWVTADLDDRAGTELREEILLQPGQRRLRVAR